MKKEKKRKNRDAFHEEEMAQSRLVRGLLIAAGTIFVGLGLLGIILPILPTTPFLLLAAACYARSSKRFYDWLLTNKWFGSYLKNYWEGKGIPLKVKVLSISFLWTTIIISMIFILTSFIIRIILTVIAIVVTIHILSLRTLKQ